MGRLINLKSIFVFTIICFLGIQVNAQDKEKDKNKKASIEVKGNCGMCKSRVEKAATKVKGVKYASWDIPSNKMTVIIDENKCTLIDVKKAVAAVGHDSDTELASDDIYNDLPPCCQYRDPSTKEMDHGAMKH